MRVMGDISRFWDPEIETEKNEKTAVIRDKGWEFLDIEERVRSSIWYFS